MLPEQFSAEWAVIALMGVVGVPLSVFGLETLSASAHTLLLFGAIYSLLFYPILLGLGRAPIAITYETETAAGGYPRLSVIPPVIAAAIWAGFAFA